MINGLYEAHSGWRYIVIVFLVVALVKYLIGIAAKQEWKGLDEFLGRYTPIVIDIQWLLGIILWIVQQRWNGVDPLASFEHPVVMTLALVAGHIGWSRARKATSSSAKFRAALVGFLIAGLLVALGVARITRVM